MGIKIIRQIMNVLSTLFVIGTMLWLSGLLTSEWIDRQHWLRAFEVYLAVTAVAKILLYIIAYLGGKFKVAFLSETLKYKVWGIGFELVTWIGIALALSLTGDALA